MKKIIIILLVTVVYACNTEKNKKHEIKETKESSKTTIKKEIKPAKKTSASTNSKIVPQFLSDITSLQAFEKKNPITLFKKSAEKNASKILNLSKGNFSSVVTLGKEYKHCVITKGEHTIAKIISFDDCIQSGSWAECMPLAEGYVKKGKLISKKDYLNNIIGIPDSQERKVYFFN